MLAGAWRGRLAGCGHFHGRGGAAHAAFPAAALVFMPHSVRTAAGPGKIGNGRSKWQAAGGPGAARPGRGREELGRARLPAPGVPEILDPQAHVA